MIRRLTDFLLASALPPGETGESIRADLEEEVAELRERHPGRAFRYWLLWEAAKLAVHFGLLRLEPKSRREDECGQDRARSERVIASLARDVRFATRTFRRRPLFTTVSILTLGLGIGSATAMFSVVDGVLLQSVPFRDPVRLVNVWLTEEGSRGAPGLVGKTWNRLPLSLAEYRKWRAENTVFEGVAVHNAIETTLTGEESAERVTIGLGSASLLSVLGVRPLMGRWFLPSEEGTVHGGAERVTVVSYRTWRDRLDSDAEVLGKTLLLDGTPHTIVGVLPEGFRLRHLGMHWLGEDRDGVRDVWAPLGSGRLGNGNNLEAIARLGAGVSMERAMAETRAILLEGREPGDVRIVRRAEDETSGLSAPLLLLLAGTGLLLLIACANIATLALGELSGRESELRTRGALGAGRGRIVRQLMVESLVLGILGAAVGVVLAIGGTGFLVALAPPLPRVETVGVDVRVLGFAVACGVSAAVLFGSLPALVSTRASAGRVATTRTVTGRRAGLEPWLVSFEVALTVVLLVSGGLLVRSLDRLLDVDPGFVPEGLATVSVYLPLDRYATGSEIIAAYDEMLTRVEALHGVARVSAVTRLPFPGLTNSNSLPIAGAGNGGVRSIQAQQLVAMPGYHEAMGIPLVAGEYLPRDGPGEAIGVVITENIARRYWPEGSPLGSSFARWGGTATIVGIAGDVKRNALGVDADPAFYTSLRQRPSREVSLVARTTGDATALAGRMRDIVRAFDAGIPVRQVTTLPDLIRASTAQEGYRTLLMEVFGALATLLAAVGVFGVTARGIARRAREMGVRISLGAEEGRLVSMVVRAALVPSLLGTAGGLLLAAWAGRLLAGFLFGVASFDPLTYGVVAGFLAVVSLAASYLPARRIASLDAARVLRAH